MKTISFADATEKLKSRGFFNVEKYDACPVCGFECDHDLVDYCPICEIILGCHPLLRSNHFHGVN